jgi:SAM-dependent methyltransferase
MLPIGSFRYNPDQAGFVPDEWLWWTREPGTLMRCPDCGSQGPLRRPSPALLAEWYRRQDYAAADLLSEGHRQAERRLRQAGLRNLVDIGCGPGTFLDTLPAAVNRFGLEPSEASTMFGRQRGRQIVAPDSSGWSADLPELVDAVTLFDVIEHIAQPREFLANLAKRLSPGGRLAIFTGNAGSRWARSWGIRWWYHGWTGHLSCFTAAGIRSLLAQAGLEVESLDELPYMAVPQSIRTRARTSVLLTCARLGLLGILDSLRPPMAWCPLGLDHMLVVARSPR